MSILCHWQHKPPKKMHCQTYCKQWEAWIACILHRQRKISNFFIFTAAVDYNASELIPESVKVKIFPMGACPDPALPTTTSLAPSCKEFQEFWVLNQTTQHFSQYLCCFVVVLTSASSTRMWITHYCTHRSLVCSIGELRNYYSIFQPFSVSKYSMISYNQHTTF